MRESRSRFYGDHTKRSTLIGKWLVRCSRLCSLANLRRGSSTASDTPAKKIMFAFCPNHDGTEQSRRGSTEGAENFLLPTEECLYL
jgi:hypothetical protein